MHAPAAPKVASETAGDTIRLRLPRRRRRQPYLSPDGRHQVRTPPSSSSPPLPSLFVQRWASETPSPSLRLKNIYVVMKVEWRLLLVDPGFSRWLIGNLGSYYGELFDFFEHMNT